MAKLSDIVAKPGFAPLDWQAEAPRELFNRGMPVMESADLARIVALPRRLPMVPGSLQARALVEHEMAKYSRPNPACRCKTIDPRRDCITRFLDVQAWALYEMGIANGLIGSIPVGGGKTIVGILAALALRDVRRALLLIPPTLVEQIIVDYEMLSQHFRVPGIIVHTYSENGREYQSMIPDQPTLHVLPYSRLSGPENSDVIERIRPDVIIADECDSLKDLTSARTMRVMRYFSGSDKMTVDERRDRQKTRFCGWTGSITDHSIMEYAHLALLALRERSPVPLSREVAMDWGRCLDAVPSPCPPGALLRLCEPGEEVRVAYRRRLSESMGFLITTSSDVHIEATGGTVDLDVVERQAPQIPSIVEEALEKVRNFRRPDTMAGSMDDEELVDAMSQAKCAHEIACGMFYRWIFPRGEPVAVIREWFEARKLWNKELRLQMLQGEEHLDSPKLCESAAMRAYGEAEPRPDRPDWDAEHWPRWRDVKDLVEPKTQAVRLHSFLAEDAAQWATTNRGILWYGMVEFAAWVHELTGLTVHSGGPNAGALLRAEKGERSIIASLKSHGRGRDGLQHLYHHQLVANPPASASMWQQALGRLHRRGQKHDRVLTEVYLHTPELEKSFDQAMRRGEYVRDTLGEQQKLLRGWRIGNS